jgi:hypothetical protein
MFNSIELIAIYNALERLGENTTIRHKGEIIKISDLMEKVKEEGLKLL